MPVDPQRIEFEAKLTFLERTVEVLQGHLLDQGQIIIAFERRLEELERAQREGDDEGAGGADTLRPHDDPPPHY